MPKTWQKEKKDCRRRLIVLNSSRYLVFVWRFVMLDGISPHQCIIQTRCVAAFQVVYYRIGGISSSLCLAPSTLAAIVSGLKRRVHCPFSQFPKLSSCCCGFHFSPPRQSYSNWFSDGLFYFLIAKRERCFEKKERKRNTQSGSMRFGHTTERTATNPHLITRKNHSGTTTT